MAKRKPGVPMWFKEAFASYRVMPGGYQQRDGQAPIWRASCSHWHCGWWATSGRGGPGSWGGRDVTATGCGVGGAARVFTGRPFARRCGAVVLQ